MRTIDSLSSIHLQEPDRHIGHGSVEREYYMQRASMVYIYMIDLTREVHNGDATEGMDRAVYERI